jgi:hypothetical protein
MTTDDQAEVSTFALDTYFAAGRPPDAVLERHLSGCLRCQRYLAHLEAFAATPTHARGVLSIPSSRGGMELPGLRERAGHRWGMAAVGLALAASVAGIARLWPNERYVGVKGTPAVQLLVRHHQDTAIWDGHAAVHPGDSLALRVACEGLARVAVASWGPGGWRRLSDSECPGANAPLPFTLLVDGEPGSERLAVVLSHVPMDDETLRGAIDATRRTTDVWVVDFLLPKATSP